MRNQAIRALQNMWPVFQLAAIEKPSGLRGHNELVARPHQRRHRRCPDPEERAGHSLSQAGVHSLVHPPSVGGVTILCASDSS